ncbi:hypothetical protein AB6A40_010448 [Gnathostoma spinigerum]|uniref:Pre-rRNA-processing protein TSR2 homolog n=1 Tax=Gnathostoma spinigerum TaxID=75299 RepID=A0ABD6EZR7_9BILA
MSSCDMQNLSSFHEVVSSLLSSWTAYQLAVKLHFGGAETDEKSEWFVDVLTNFLEETKDIDSYELIDWLSEVLYNEFDLIVEDGSTDFIADSLLKCQRWWKEECRENIILFLETLPSSCAVERAAMQSNGNASDDEEESSTESGSEDNMDSSKSRNRQKTGRQPRMVTDEDGWTTVCPRP